MENSIHFNDEDVIIYWVDEDEEGQCLKEITIDKNGELSDWPENVFREGLEEILEMKRILGRKDSSQ